MKPRSLIVVAALLLASLFSPTIYAQELGEFTSSVSVGPLLLDVDVAPGEVWRGEFAVAAGKGSRSATFDPRRMK